MSSKSGNYLDAMKSIDLEPSDEAKTQFSISGQQPKEIIEHKVETTYYIIGITPKEFIDLHGGTQFDFDKIIRQFAAKCKDFNDAIYLDQKNRSVEFASKIIYEVGPEARKIKKKDGDKTWVFHFTYKEHGRLEVQTVFVSTFKATGVKSSNEKLILTVKQATLLAVLVLEKINGIAVQLRDKPIMLTPLAGAVFSRDDVSKLSHDLNTSELEVLNTINSSCQSGGQYLNSSQVDVAAIASIVATRGLKDEDMKKGIITKTVKQFIARKKNFDPSRFNTYAIYASGGVPQELSADNLINLFNDIQKVERGRRSDALTVARETQLVSKIDVPHFTHGLLKVVDHNQEDNAYGTTPTTTITPSQTKTTQPIQTDLTVPLPTPTKYQAIEKDEMVNPTKYKVGDTFASGHKVILSEDGSLHIINGQGKHSSSCNCSIKSSNRK